MSKPVFISRIHRLHLWRGVRLPTPNECPGYDSKQSDDAVPVLGIWGIWSTIASKYTLTRSGSI